MQEIVRSVPFLAPTKDTETKDKEESPLGEAKKLPLPKTTRRLEVFLEAYREKYHRPYLISNFSEHGGAAKRTEKLIPDESVYRRAVRAYLAAGDKRLVESSHPFFWFIRDLNRWVGVAQGGSYATNYTGFADKNYHEGVW